MRVQIEYSGQTINLEEEYRINTDSDLIDLIERALKAIEIDVEIKKSNEV